MPDPVLVPATPTIGQPPTPNASDSAVAESIQRNFDRLMPSKDKAPPPAAAAPPPAAPPEVTPPPPPAEAQPPAETPKPDEVDVPSFLADALRGDEPPKPATPSGEEEWPEELPTFKSSEEAKARYKKWREAHKAMRSELEHARQRPSSDPEQQQKLQTLEAQNRQMQETLSRFGVEHSAEFQQNIMTPLTAAWSEAARIVHESGGDVNALGKAMSLSGRAQFEALDEIFGGMPESARAEANDALRAYRRFEEARQAYLKNAPAAFEAIQKRETERQLQNMEKQREGMKGVFERAIQSLRDNKLEVLMRTELPEGEWWNKQADQIVEQARTLLLDNTDMNKVAVACLLAPAAEAYRRLWLNSQKKIGQLNRVIKERLGNEPNLSESGGPGNVTPNEQFEADLKQPFDKVFLREFHRQQAKGQ